jgi:hypothetical protein
VVQGTEDPVVQVSEAFASGGFLFLSYEDEHTTAAAEEGGSSTTERRWWLQVLDMTGANGSIVMRPRASCPGLLRSLHQADAQGAVLLTSEDKFNPEMGKWTSAIHAAAYNGVDVFQIDEEEIQYYNPWGYYYQPTASMTADGVRVFVAEPDSASSESTTVTPITFDTKTNELSRLPTWKLGHPSYSYSLQAVGGLLLASKYGEVSTATIGADGSLTPEQTYEAPDGLQISVRDATTDADSVYLPVGEYGVEILER